MLLLVISLLVLACRSLSRGDPLLDALSLSLDAPVPTVHWAFDFRRHRIRFMVSVTNFIYKKTKHNEYLELYLVVPKQAFTTSTYHPKCWDVSAWFWQQHHGGDCVSSVYEMQGIEACMRIFGFPNTSVAKACDRSRGCDTVVARVWLSHSKGCVGVWFFFLRGRELSLWCSSTGLCHVGPF